jgi:DNA adenine methylase
MSFYSPLRYPGGKNCIFNFVSNLLEENELVGHSYAEPYAGGAGLALRLLFEEYVEKIYINDLDVAIYAFWQTIINEPDKFCRWIDKLVVNMDAWHKYKSIYEKKNAGNLFELAQATFFLNRTNVSGVIKGGVIGGKAQNGKYKINARFKKDVLIERIQKIARYKNRISISNEDGITFAKRINNMEEKVFLYLDPPYYGKGADLYMNYFSENDHRVLSSFVKNLDKKWMVSYDNNQFILNLYSEMNRVLYKLSQSASNRVGNEVLIFSELLNFTVSINKLAEPELI